MTGASDLDTDTLQTVTDRGNITTNDIGAGTITGNTLVITGVNSTFKAFEQANDDFRIGTDTADDISIITNGSRRLTVTDAGFVGIGTTDPAYALTVNAGTTNQIARFISSDNDAVIGIQDSNDAVFIGYDAALDVMSLGFDSSMGVSSNVNIDTGGSVGIGTNNPSRPLHVKSSTNHAKIRLTNDGNKNWDFMVGNSGYFSGYFMIHDSSAGERLAINDLGYVGIGSNAPQGLLDVKADTDQHVFLGRARFGSHVTDYLYLSHYDNANTTSYALNQSPAGSTSINAKAGMNVSMKVNNDPIVFVKGSTSNVGIETNSPEAKLHIENTAYDFDSSPEVGDLHLMLRDLDSSVSGDAISMGFAQSTDTNTVGAKLSFLTEGSFSRGSLVFSTNSTADTGDNTAERMRIASGGNVGIGTTAPSDILDVAGALRLTSNISFDASKSGRIYKASNHGLAFHGVAGSENNFAMFTPAGQLMIVNPAGTNDVSLIPTAAGNVGIGTTDPSTKLHVEGTGTFHSVDITGTSTLTVSGKAGIGTAVPSDLLSIVSTVNNNGFRLDYPATSNTAYPFYIGKVDDSKYVRVNANGIALKNNGAESVIKTEGSLNNLNIQSRFDLIFTSNESTEAMRIASGNVGIGSASPQAKIDVVASTNDGIRIDENNALLGSDGTTTGSTQLLYWNGTHAYYGRYTTAPFDAKVDSHFFRTNGSNRLAVRTTGVSINHTNPSFDLDVDGTIHGTSGNFENGITIDGNPVLTGTSAFETDTLQTVTDEGNSTTNPISALAITGTAGLNQFKGSTADSASHTIVARNSSNTSLFSIRNDGRVDIPVGPVVVDTDTLYVDTSNDRVGVNTSSPSRDLQIGNGGSNAVVAIVASNTALSQLAFGDNADDNYGQILVDHSANKLQIQNGGGGPIIDRGITLDSSENVGIGTSSPTTTLDVYKSSSTSATSTGTTLFKLHNYVGNDLNQQKTFIDFL